MNTTNIIVEFLVIGIQVALWLAILILIIFGTSSIQGINLKESATLVTAALIAISYPIGIVVDNLADLIFWLPDGWLRKNAQIDKESKAITSVRMFLKGDSLLAKQLEYQRMRIRLSRSSFFNFILIGVTSYYLVKFRFDDSLFDTNMLLTNKEQVAWYLLVFCVFIAIVSLIAWITITKNYYKRFYEANFYLNSNNCSMNVK